MTPVVVFDDRPPDLAVLIDLRPAALVRTGCLTNLERLEHALGRPADALFTPPDVAAAAVSPRDVAINRLPPGGETLLINGRCVLPPDGLDELPAGGALLSPEGDVIAFRAPTADAEAFLDSFNLPAKTNVQQANRPCLLRKPWDVIRFRDEAIAQDLRFLGRHASTSLPPGVLAAGPGPISIDPTATIAPTVYLDSEKGPIVIRQGATVRPGAIIVGPACIGEGATVLEHALIKANTAIGPVCKVAGEVGGTIFQGYANKGHDGHLGDSWVGRWVNLGAGTTNSNLLNTYGEVSAASSPSSERERTGLTFLGAVIGDHVKTAIGTRLMTGSVIGTGAMIASTAPPPTTVRRFAWITDRGERDYKLDRFLDAAQRVMSRRDVELTEFLRERVAALHEHTAHGSA